MKISLLISLCFLGCAHIQGSNRSISEAGSSKIIFDTKLIQEWTEEKENSEPCKKPYLVKYTNGEKTLYFVAAKHGDGPPTFNKTFQLVEGVFNKYHPDFLIVETIRTSSGKSPPSAIVDAQKCIQDEFKRCNERFYSIHFALKNQIPFIGGEPDDMVYMTELNQKYSKEDIVGWFYYLHTVRWKRRGQLDFRKTADEEKEVEQLKDRFQYEMTFDNFVAWFKRTTGREFTAAEVTSDNLAPVKDSRNFFQRFSYDQDPVREPHVVKTIERALNEFDRVIVVFGAGHHIMDGPVFTKSLGTPSFECD